MWYVLCGVADCIVPSTTTEYGMDVPHLKIKGSALFLQLMSVPSLFVYHRINSYLPTHQCSQQSLISFSAAHGNTNRCRILLSSQKRFYQTLLCRPINVSVTLCSDSRFTLVVRWTPFLFFPSTAFTFRITSGGYISCTTAFSF